MTLADLSTPHPANPSTVSETAVRRSFQGQLAGQPNADCTSVFVGAASKMLIYFLQVYYNGLVSAGQQRESAPPPSTPASWPSRLGADVSVTAHSVGSRSNVLSFAGGKGLPTQHGGTSPHVRRQSAGSGSTGSRLSTGRSQFTCHSMCSGMWYALKRLGLHLRVKVAHSTKY